MTVKEIVDLFEKEFSSHKHKFEIVDLIGSDIRSSQDIRVARSGVYVFCKDSEVIKVGGSLSNARKRALEHFTDNTKQIMKNLNGDPNLHLLLFTVEDREDEHWAIALEDFLERKLNPKIPSERRR